MSLEFSERRNEIQPSVSILTSSWNRCKYLKKLYESVLSQTYKNISWIVVDDGSNDGTKEFMESVLNEGQVDVIYARFSNRVGKCRGDNLMLELAKTDFVIWCDSDDYLKSESIEKLINEWNNIPKELEVEYLAILGMCCDVYGKLQSSNSKSFQKLKCLWGQLDADYGMSGDMCILFKREKIGRNRFPEKDLVMTESGFWNKFINMPVICIPEVLKVMYRETGNRVSGSPKMEYTRGKAYAIAYADAPVFLSFSSRKQVLLSSKYHRYCIHGEIGMTERNILFRCTKNWAYYLGLLIGSVQALKDISQRRVVKTHRIFLSNLSIKPVVKKTDSIVEGQVKRKSFKKFQGNVSL